MSTDLEEIITQIMEHTGKSREDVKKDIQKKITDFGGLLTEEGAANFIASEVGVKKRARLPDSVSVLKIKDLEADMQNVTIIGRIKEIHAPYTFEKNGQKLKMCNIILIDETGEANLTLWRNDVNIISELKLKPGDIIKITGAYIKEYKGRKQINKSSKGNISVENPAHTDIPPVNETTKNIEGITAGEDNINVEGLVGKIFGIRTFKRDETEGKVAAIELLDKTGKIRVTFWGDQANVITHLKQGDIIRIYNAYSREGLQGTELNVGWRSHIEINPPDIDKSKMPQMNIEKIMDISAVTEGEGYIAGTIVYVYPGKFEFYVCPKCGGKLRQTENSYICEKDGEIEKPAKRMVVSFDVDDGTGVIRATAFGALADMLIQLHSEVKSPEEIHEIAKRNMLGQRVAIQGMVKKDDYSGELQITIRNLQYIKSKDITKQIINNIEV